MMHIDEHLSKVKVDAILDVVIRVVSTLIVGGFAWAFWIAALGHPVSGISIAATVLTGITLNLCLVTFKSVMRGWQSYNYLKKMVSLMYSNEGHNLSKVQITVLGEEDSIVVPPEVKKH